MDGKKLMTETVFRFGGCEVRTMRRELVADGCIRFIEPRPFDLLVHLLKHRHRVVSKDELLDVLWHDEVVSVGVIARAVMKVRQAIGDSGNEAGHIRTVHRKGYRFVGTVETGEGPDPGAAAAPPEASPGNLPLPSTHAGTLTLALLPFANDTGSAEYDWIELGLMSMVARSLAADHRLALASTASVLTTLAGEPEGGDVDARMLRVKRVLGVTHVMHTVVRRDGERFVLEFGIGPGPAARTRLPGEDPLFLASQLAREVRVALFPGNSPALPAAFDSSDPLAGPVLARAMQAVGEQKWKAAVNLLQVVLDIEQDSLPIRLEQLAALAALGDRRAIAIGEQLLADPRVIAEPLWSARVHQALGMAFNNLREAAPAVVHLDEALRLAEGHELEDWVAITLLLRSSIAIGQLDLDMADGLLRRALRLCEQSGNQVHRLGWMVNAALVCAKRGELLCAMQLGRDAVALSAEHRLNSYFALTSLNLAHACLGLGLVRPAVRHAEDAFAMAGMLAERFRMASSADTLCLLYRELRSPDEIERVLWTLEQAQAELPPAARTYLLMGRGHHAAATGRHAEAAGHFAQAIELGKQLLDWLTVHESTPWLVAALVQSGQQAQALSVCEQVAALPQAVADADLQASMLHCRALLDHGAGDSVHALQGLHAAVVAAPMGMWRTHACLDAAWLHLEAGEPDAARALLRDLGTWIEEHPVAAAVEARLRFARGQYAGADEAHKRYASRLQSAMPACFEELGRRYAEAACAMPSQMPSLPAVPWLPTRM
jgi:DNA-binding winged helix-turn-helix (wHTH) protein/tetratricopeptide (TPR) repeat protein